jgi:hypothetical protein
MLLARLDQQRMRTGLRNMHVGPKIEGLFERYWEHRFNASATFKDLLENWQGTLFELNQMAALFNRHKDVTLNKLLPYVDLSPNVSGPSEANAAVDKEETFTITGFPFMDYHAYRLDDNVHLVVHANVHHDRFKVHWNFSATAGETELFNQVYVYRCIGGEWHIQENQFADDYRQAYALMNQLSG